jgi:hypothetical protein
MAAPLFEFGVIVTDGDNKYFVCELRL